MSDHQWYYTQGASRLGPVTGDALSDLAATGTINPQDLIWCAAMPDWAPASTIPGLFAEVLAAAEPAQFATIAPIQYFTPPRSRVIYAGFWARFCASFVDGIVTGVIIAIVGLICDALIRQDSGVVTASHILSVVVPWLYEATMESSGAQATLGKMALGIKVTSTAGHRISFAQATGRSFAKYISAITLGIGFLMAGFTKRKQALHDMIAGTLVVRK